MTQNNTPFFTSVLGITPWSAPNRDPASIPWALILFAEPGRRSIEDERVKEKLIHRYTFRLTLLVTPSPECRSAILDQNLELTVREFKCTFRDV
ncbi:hypothetical protein AC579_4658 [Pseudocercospora musae]|uniref:Uncharacterized protein n=1 Tax=Pseudocercospora musae TaxID=113226 RepID=A0A139IBD9_9PEZI|nr:hypothetical protein AC579_4658 [Pseudocercospora musae]